MVMIDETAAGPKFVRTMDQESAPVFGRLPLIGGAGGAIAAVRDLNLVGDRPRRAAQPLHRPGTPAQGTLLAGRICP